MEVYEWQTGAGVWRGRGGGGGVPWGGNTNGLHSREWIRILSCDLFRCTPLWCYHSYIQTLTCTYSYTHTHHDYRLNIDRAIQLGLPLGASVAAKISWYQREGFYIQLNILKKIIWDCGFSIFISINKLCFLKITAALKILISSLFKWFWNSELIFLIGIIIAIFGLAINLLIFRQGRESGICSCLLKRYV